MNLRCHRIVLGRVQLGRIADRGRVVLRVGAEMIERRVRSVVFAHGTAQQKHKHPRPQHVDGGSTHSTPGTRR